MAETNKIVPMMPSEQDCKELVEVLARVGDKWTVMIVGALSYGPMRYNQLRHRIGAISQRMLTLTLKGLEQDGLVTRTLYPTIPPRVDYELTELGKTLRLSLKPLHAWATAHKGDIAEARLKFSAMKKRTTSDQTGKHTPSLRSAKSKGIVQR
jgi:DNA-binding HxlR family transcriptional regulator